MRAVSHRAPFLVALVACLGLVPFGVATTSCGSETCTLIGCGEGLTLEFDKTVPRDYTVTVTIDGTTGTADCTAAAEPDTSLELSVGLTGLEMGITCGPQSLVFMSSPEKVSVVITFPDGVTTTVNADPAYEEYYPNGEDCDEDDPCLRATYDMVINPPTS